MTLPGNKKIICITGTVWTYGTDAPRHQLIGNGFVRPTWFTTGRRITDAHYMRITTGGFHLACAKDEVLAYIKYGSDFIGISYQDMKQAIDQSTLGVLVVGPQNLVVQIAEKLPQTMIFTFKEGEMMLSSELNDAQRRGQVRRIDINTQQSNAWHQVTHTILEHCLQSGY